MASAPAIPVAIVFFLHFLQFFRRDFRLVGIAFEKEVKEMVKETKHRKAPTKTIWVIVLPNLPFFHPFSETIHSGKTIIRMLSYP